MTGWLLRLALPGVALLLGATSHAATLAFSGTLTVGVGTIPPVSLVGSGMATVNGSGGGVHLNSLLVPSGVFAGATSTPVLAAAPISGFELAGGVVRQTFTIAMIPFSFVYPTGSASNLAGSFAGLSGGPGGGAMPLNGVFLVCLFGGGGGGGAAGCGGNPGSNMVVPLGIAGVGGSSAYTAGINITSIGAPWTIQTAAVFGSTVMGFAHGPGSGTSTAAQPSGVVSLVTPIFVSTYLATFPIVPTFSRVTLHFVPEPTTMLLLGAGVVALGMIGRRMNRP